MDSFSGEGGVSNESDEEDSSSDDSENPDAEVGVDTDKFSKEVSDHVNDKGFKGAN